jgi:phosphoglycolate phosphatase-like HAD superfamily hydrolase
LINLEKEVYNPNYKVFEGVKEFLEWAEKKGRFLMGLATGNLEKGAKIKLRPSSLLKYFKFGGYASDSWKRSEILKKAYQRGLLIAEEENSKIKEVFVIGDTPRDVIAAKEAGFKSIGMALYNFSEKDLEKVGADYVFKNYSKLKEFFSQYISFSEG